MGIVTILIMLAGGVLGAAAMIVAKKPDAQELINKLVPYQGWIGVVMFLWGIWGIIGTLTSLGLLGSVPLWWIAMLAASATQLLLGFLLGYGLIAKYALSKNAQAMEKGQEVLKKLAKFQGPLGITAILVAIFYAVILFTFV